VSVVDHLMEQNAEKDAIIARLRVKIQALEKKRDEAIRHRQAYPEGPRDPDSRRLVVKCLQCHEERILRGRGLCATCYNRRYRRLHPRTRVGSR
jgi:hypothetical protein